MDRGHLVWMPAEGDLYFYPSLGCFCLVVRVVGVASYLNFHPGFNVEVLWDERGEYHLLSQQFTLGPHNTAMFERVES